MIINNKFLAIQKSLELILTLKIAQVLVFVEEFPAHKFLGQTDMWAVVKVQSAENFLVSARGWATVVCSAIPVPTNHKSNELLV